MRSVDPDVLTDIVKSLLDLSRSLSRTCSLLDQRIDLVHEELNILRVRLALMENHNDKS